MSRGSLKTLAARTLRVAGRVARMAKAADLDVLRIGVDELQTAIALSEFIARTAAEKSRVSGPRKHENDKRDLNPASGFRASCQQRTE